MTHYGAQAVYGRTLFVGEMRRMNAAENIVMAYQSRARYRDENGSENWVAWAQKYPDLSEILMWAETVNG